MSQLRCAIYCRVSTREQADEGISLDFQRHLCREAALKAGATFVEEFVDEGFSGTVWERPRLQEFLSRLGDFDTLYVFRLDRLSRSIRDWANIMAALSDHSVGFVSITEKFDFSSPFGKAMMAMLAVFAELFVDILRENVRAAFTERTRQGLHNGIAPTGYKRTGDARAPLAVDDEALSYITELFSRYAAGESLFAISLDLERKTGHRHYVNTLGRMLRNPVYIGQVRHLGEVYEGAHEPIVDAALWRDCNRRLLAEAPIPASARRRTLTPVYRCGLCGGRVNQPGNGGKPHLRSYHCSMFLLRRVEHGSVSVTAAKADALTWQVLRDLISEGVLRDAAQAGQRRAKKTAQSDRVKTLQAEHDDLGKKIAFAYRAQVDGGLDMATLLEVNKPLVARREKIERELQGIRSPEPLPEVFSLTAATLDKLIAGADIERQRNLLLSVFERVEIHPDRLRYVPRLPDLQALEVAIPRYYAPARGGRLNVCYL